MAIATEGDRRVNAPTPGAADGSHLGGSTRIRRIAEVLSAVIVALMAVTSVMGLLIDDLYRDGAWAREALRGGDLTTLVLVAPALAISVILVRRGSRRAVAVWIGALAYGVYNYAYYAFGAAFNDVFVLHIALLSLSIWATVLAAASFDVGAVAGSFAAARGGRWVGAYLALVGTILGGLWVALAVRYAITGELMADIPQRGIHLVFAIDLSLLVPSLLVAGILLWRRTAIGVVFGAAMTVMGALYQVNLLVSGVFQANADVAGVTAFPPEGVGVAIGFGVASIVLFRRGRR